MHKATVPICVAFLLFSWNAIAAILPSASHRDSTRRAISAICAAQPLSSSVVGVFAMRMDGDTIACVNPSLRLVPASNIKLITTGTALYELGEDHRFETRLAHSGSIGEDGTLHGDLYIIGKGDPTTGANVPCAEPVASLFAKWAKLIRQAGISRIEGRIVADPRHFSEPVGENLGWTYDDLGTNYGVAPTGLNFFENAQNFLVTPGPTEGSAPNIRQYYPETPWLHIDNEATTGPRGSSNSLYYVNTHLAAEGMFAGSFPVDRRAYTFEGSNRYGAYTCAWYFSNYLKDNGIDNKGAADVLSGSRLRIKPGAPASGKAAGEASLTVIGSTWSMKLPSILRETNCESDNFFAETMLKTMAQKRSGSVEHSHCVSSIEAALTDLGLNPAGACQIFDGSGLSRKNYVSPGFFVDFLTVMLKGPHGETFLRTLPSPGEKGTLEYKFPSETPQFRARIKMKSGSMNGIRSYSGYILSSDGNPDHTIVFSLIINNSTASSWMLNPVIDSIIKHIASEN